MNEEWQEQEAPAELSMDQMVMGLIWELQALRHVILALNETVSSLNKSLREE